MAQCQPSIGTMDNRAEILLAQNFMGLDRIELSTSPLSGVRSSQLSYRPR